jgi:hypothetical protein
MDRLFPLVESYQLAPDLERRMSLMEEIISLIAPKLRLAVLRVGSFHDAEDVFQTTLLVRLATVFEGDRGGTFRGSRGKRSETPQIS